MNIPFIRWLDQVRQADKSLVGSKAANLGEMIVAGIPCPRGFCVTTAAFSHFAKQSAVEGLLNKLKGLSQSGLRNDRSKKLIVTARQRIRSADIPDEIASCIKEAYSHLSKTSGVSGLLVAIRSSAVSEDLPGASFAGQFDSFLGVRGAQPVLDDVRGCWLSLLNERAVEYTKAAGHRCFDALMGVIVQEMVLAEKSGVAFTVHPVSGDTSQVLIEATWGLGQTLVSGAVNPDTYIVDKDSAQIRDKHIPRKQRGAFIDIANAQGTVVQEIPLSQQDVDCLSEDEVRSLVGFGKKIEAIFSCPQDIEWAIDGSGRIFILQARPVTGLADQVTGIHQGGN